MTNRERAEQAFAELDNEIENKARELNFNGDFAFLEAKLLGYRGFIITFIEELMDRGLWHEP